MWAAGVLAYELVVGRAPFEVKDESQTASMIMFSNNIHFPSQYSQLWSDFVKTVRLHSIYCIFRARPLYRVAMNMCESHSGLPAKYFSPRTA